MYVFFSIFITYVCLYVRTKTEIRENFPDFIFCTSTSTSDLNTVAFRSYVISSRCRGNKFHCSVCSTLHNMGEGPIDFGCLFCCANAYNMNYNQLQRNSTTGTESNGILFYHF